MRFTKSTLERHILEVNQELLQAGSTYSYKYGSRNGYHAVDLLQGEKVIRCLDCNESPRTLSFKLEDDYTFYLDK